jgi:hypothetical protein
MDELPYLFGISFTKIKHFVPSQAKMFYFKLIN